MDFLHFFNRVFELPLLRNAQKRTKKKAKKNILGLVGSLKVNQTYVEVRQFFFECPSGAINSAQRTFHISHIAHYNILAAQTLKIEIIDS
jgi:hypothetical protein